MITPDTVVHLLQQYGYFVLFLIAIMEGPIITIIGAFLASQGYFNIFAVYATVIVGDLAGDLFYYGIGWLGQSRALVGIRQSFGMTGGDFARIERYIKQHGAKTLLFAKYTQTGFLALPACGAARMPIWSFLWYNVLGTIPKSLILVIIGWFFGFAYNRINGYFVKASFAFIAIFCIVGAYLWLHRYLRANYGQR